jgi:hypothetical protein
MMKMKKNVVNNSSKFFCSFGDNNTDCSGQTQLSLKNF